MRFFFGFPNLGAKEDRTSPELNAIQLAQVNEDGLNEVDRVTEDQTYKINKDVLEKMKPNSEPFRKSNRIKKATSIKQNDFLWSM
jgi:hypothetical protein